ncbi:MAG: DNA-binding protein WhiA [Eubacteriales bacterium]
MTEYSFSKSIKADLLKVTDRTKEEMQAELVTAFLCAGRPGADKSELPLFFATSSFAYAERLAGQLRAIGMDALAEKSEKASRPLWYVYPLPSDQMTFNEQLRLYEKEEKQDQITSSMQPRRAALRGAFLASGIMSEPLKAYQIEIPVRNSRAANYLTLLLHAENIEPSIIYRNGHPVIYFKEGQAIGDFLALIGAHSSLLRFESIRVDKELRNAVNRVVNCDTANARRQADACVRQSTLMRDLLDSSESTQIPQELMEAARVRVDNPGMSIKDLGLLMSPPIGKSGMNHRLRKLEEIAKEAGLV